MTNIRSARSTGGRGGSGPRILGGCLRGRKLGVAPGVRPTESRLREALFSIWHGRVAGCRFLDLFAGSGAIGLEAASRGAHEVVFVEQAPRVLGTLRRNLSALPSASSPPASSSSASSSSSALSSPASSPPATSKVWRWRLPRDLVRLCPEEMGATPFDLVFADPPYAFTEYESLLGALPPWLTPSGELVVEHSRRAELPETLAPWRRSDHRCYGDACFSFYQSDTLS